MADASGSVYLWLTNGIHFVTANGVLYVADVDEQAVNAELFELTGVYVDGVDVAYRRGDGWQFAQRTLSFSENRTVSGTNVQGKVAIMVEPTVETLSAKHII